MASPFLIGLVIGAAIYFWDQSLTGLLLGLLVALLGLVVGIIWATKQWKGKGTVWFMSRTMATPELDDEDGTNRSGRIRR